MKKAQLIGLAIAGACGVGAFLMMKNVVNKPQVIQKEVSTNLVEVLVARNDIGLGQVTSESHFRWQPWPQDNIQPGFVTRRAGQSTSGMKDYTGRIARAPIMGGEPITAIKLIKAGEGGVLASILPEGYRAISAKITDDTAVGKMILPNDHVDVILIRRLRGRGGAEEHVSDTLFRNIRVLAIGQVIQVGDPSKKGADGTTATLQLTSRQAELLALAKSMGEISLVLRSVADFKKDADGNAADAENLKSQRGNAVRVLRYGVRKRDYGVN
ncbi:MAG TPA: Flp pilus assembly protein CpaB [Hyphomicrobiaceae bacterium]|nr:Flp pilus assembly protein CpaB [Hyphomicrobiaceae bacterium]